MPRRPRRDPRGSDFINGPTPRETDVITTPTRYALHSYAKLGAARWCVFTTARHLTPWDAYFGSNSTRASGKYQPSRHDRRPSPLTSSRVRVAVQSCRVAVERCREPSRRQSHHVLRSWHGPTQRLDVACATPASLSKRRRAPPLAAFATRRRHSPHLPHSPPLTIKKCLTACSGRVTGREKLTTLHAHTHTRSPPPPHTHKHTHTHKDS